MKHPGAKAVMNQMHKRMAAKTGKMPLESAMAEVHANVPKNVQATGKTGKAKEKMLQAIAFSKAGMSKK